MSQSFFAHQLARLATYRDLLAVGHRLNVYERDTLHLALWMAQGQIATIERDIAPIIWC